MKRVALVMLLSACSAGTMSPDEFTQEFGISASSSSKPETNVFWGPGLKQCLDQFRATVGTTDVQARSLNLYPTYAILEARSPTNPQNLDRYECRNGQVGASEPIKLGSYTKLDSEVFRFSDVDFDAIPPHIDSAVVDAAVEHGKVTMVGISRDTRDPSGVRVRISVSGARSDANVDYDGKGARAASAPAAVPSVVTKASPATWSLVDVPALAGVKTLDPLKTDWASRIATTWRQDATLYWLKAINPAPDGKVDLGRDYVELWYVSPSCLAANPADDCGLNLMVNSQAAGGKASQAKIVVNGPHDSIEPVSCTLSQAIAAATRREPRFKCAVADLHVTGRATWVLQPTGIRIDASTCTAVTTN